MKAKFHLEAINKLADTVWESGDRLLSAFAVGGDDSAQLRKILDAGNFPVAATICDMGSGFGALSRASAEYRKDLTVISLNISEEQLKYCPEPRVLADYAETGFKPESMDGLVFAFSIGHAEDQNKVFQEAFRILSPGGKIVISDLAGSPDGLWDLAYEPFNTFDGIPLRHGFSLLERKGYDAVLRESFAVPAYIMKHLFGGYRPVIWVYEKC